jgi:hypothetical protein
MLCSLLGSFLPTFRDIASVPIFLWNYLTLQDGTDILSRKSVNRNKRNCVTCLKSEDLDFYHEDEAADSSVKSVPHKTTLVTTLKTIE